MQFIFIFLFLGNHSSTENDWMTLGMEIGKSMGKLGSCLRKEAHRQPFRWHWHSVYNDLLIRKKLLSFVPLGNIMYREGASTLTS